MAIPERLNVKRVRARRKHPRKSEFRKVTALKHPVEQATVGETVIHLRRRGQATQELIGSTLPHAANRRRFRIPEPQQLRILQRFVAGENVRAIARAENRDRGTVTRIVKGEQMQAYVQRMREQYYALADAAIESVHRALQQSADGKLGHEILRNIGVVPTAAEVAIQQQLQPAVGPLTEEQAVKGEMLKLVNMAYERAEMFGQAKPSIADLRPPKQITDDSKVQ